MRLSNIRTSYHAEWNHHTDPMTFRHLTENAHSMCDASGAHQCVDLAKSPILTEATYKELTSMIDGNFLNQKIRADVLNGINLEQIEDDIMRFRINSSEFDTNKIQYQCNVKFDEWADVGQDPSLKTNEQARMLLWVGNIRLHCTCPSFLFHGYQYLLSTLDASIYDEPRKPVIKNPDERGIVCKHLNRILRVLPFYSGDMAAGLKSQFALH